MDVKTVQRYLFLLEESFVLYNLRGYSFNLRKTISKKSKYYFLDNGVLNAIINDFRSLDQRSDVGKLWENFLVSERLKLQAYKPIYAGNYFWRTWDGSEVDWVEMRDGKLFGFEFKWGQKKRVKPPPTWKEEKPPTIWTLVTPENYLEFVT